MFSYFDRQNLIKTLQEQSFDLVIVGGGILGAGVARDAALRGLRVALLEQQDFAFGTSSRSSKMVHGGLRYLERLEFGLVFEALAERAHLFEMAPHLVHPLRFVLPLYRGEAQVSSWKLKAGMCLYDVLALHRAQQVHEFWSRKEVQQRMPLLNPQNLTSAFVYSDAYMDDALLVLETLRSAVRAGACVLSYATVLGCERERSSLKVQSVRCRTKEGGGFCVRGHHFVSAAGPWTDIFGEQSLSSWTPILRPTKGVHMTFHRKRLPLKQAVVMMDAQSKRLIFMLPRHDMILVGTTDTPSLGDPNEVRADKSDVDYLIKMCERYFPSAGIQKQDVCAVFAGVRPLVDDGREDVSKTSREHKILRKHNLTFVAGGKYTTYRKIASQVVSSLLSELPFETQVRIKPAYTKGPLNENTSIEQMQRAECYIEEWAHAFGLTSLSVASLIKQYGMETEWILERFGTKFSDTLLMEAGFHIEKTMCSDLVDFYRRRTSLFLGRKDNGLSQLEALANVFAAKMGWNENTKAQKIQELREFQKKRAWRVVLVICYRLFCIG